jgi:hypothetical protein
MNGRRLTNDERKAAEAAFKGYDCDESWSASAQLIYQRILDVLVTRALRETQAPLPHEKPGMTALLQVVSRVPQESPTAALHLKR